MSSLEPKTEQHAKVKIITFTPGSIRDVENVLARELEGNTDGMAGCHLLLDFSNVTRVSSLELGTLIGLHKKQIALGGRLTLFNLSEDLYEVFVVTRLHDLISICRPGPALPPADAFVTC